MADEFGIRLSVSAADLLKSINTALDAVNKDPSLQKLKLGVDTTEIDNAVKRLKTEISSITNNVSAPKVDLNVSGAVGKSVAESVKQSQNTQINEIAKDYIKTFNIVGQKGAETARDIREKFSTALTNVFDARNGGNVNEIKQTFNELISLTKTYTRSWRDSGAISYLNDLKDGLQGVVPVSKRVWEELKFVYGSARDARSALSQAFGMKGWRFDSGTDSYLKSLPDWIIREDTYAHEADGLNRLIDLMIRARAEAKNKINVFSDDTGAEKINAFIARVEELVNVRNRESESAKSAAQSEKQAISSMQSAAEVAQKLQTAMGSIWGERAGKYASDTISDISEYQNVVNALGQALDRISSAKNLDRGGALRALNESLGYFSAGGVTPQELVNELNSFAAAEQKTTEAIKSERNAVNSLNPELEKLIANKQKALSSTVVSNNKKTGNAKIGVDTGGLIKSINAAVRDINKNSSGSLAKIKISANETGLRSSIRQAVANINKSNSLDTTPVKMSVAFKNIKQAVKDLQAQLSGQTVQINAGASQNSPVGNAVSNAGKKVTEELKNQAQAQNNVGQAAKAAAQAVSDATDVEKTKTSDFNKALTGLENRIRSVGRAMSESVTKNAANENVSRTTKSGTNTANTTVRDKWDNGEWARVSTTDTTNIQAYRKELEQMEKVSIRLKSRLETVKSKCDDLGAARPIKGKEHIESIDKLYKEIDSDIITMMNSETREASVAQEQINSKIERLKALERQYRNEEYAATKLAAKDIGTIKAEELNNLNKFINNINGSSLSADKMREIRTEAQTLQNTLNAVNDKQGLTKFYNELDVAKSKFSEMTSEAKTFADIQKNIDSGLNKIGSLLGDGALFKSQGAPNGVEKYQAIITTLSRLETEYSNLKSQLKDGSSADEVAKVKERLVELQSQLAETVNSASALKSEFKQVNLPDNMLKKVAQTRALIADVMRKNDYGMGKVDTASGSGLTFRKEFENLNAELDRTPEKVDNINARVRTLQANMKQLGYEGKSLFTSIKELGAKFIKWTSTTLLITKVRMYIRQLFTTVYELDKSLIDLRKTFKGSTNDLNDFYFEANKLAKQMGVTTNEIIKQGSAWSRLGYSSNETMKKMAEMSSMFAAISPDMNTEQATDGLVSIMKAFDIAPNDVLDGILSKVNIIGNTKATSNGEIVEMLEKSSSAMKEANNTLEQTIALETAAVEITRDASSVGNAFKTVSMRIRGRLTLPPYKETYMLCA